MRRWWATAAVMMMAAAAQGASGDEDQALAILKRAIAFRTVEGPGNQTPAFAAYLKDVLVAGGFAADDVTITPMGDTAYLVARYRGRDPKAKPLLLSGHMDVVEAKPADWTRDPFTPVVENGMIYGRGATDMKFGVALMVEALVSLKREHFLPARDVVLILSGDEETHMATTRAMARLFPDAALVLNGDGGGGQLDVTGKPAFFTLEAAEKAYADYEITFTDPGGHSSAPRPTSAITSLAEALVKLGAYRFPTELNDITRSHFRESAAREAPAVGAAMRRFADNPNDAGAIATLAANPATVGQIGTTCVATMVTAGHAPNALPQRATANVNCRIFPGHSFEEIQQALVRVVDDPKAKVTYVSGEDTTPSPASPLRPDVTAAVTKALAPFYPGVPVVPGMSAGASDNMWFRTRGVPSYGVSPVFIRDADDFSHGLNERTPLANLHPGLAAWRSMIVDLAK